MPFVEVSDKVPSAAEFTKSVLADASYAVVLFWVSWNKGCIRLRAVLDELSGDFENVRFFVVDAENSQPLCEDLSVAAVPSTLLFKHGTVCNRLDGSISVANVVAAISKFAKSAPKSGSSMTGRKPKAEACASKKKCAGTCAGKCKSKASTTSSGASAVAEDVSAIRRRIDEVVNSARIVVVMKGSPAAARCGFSRQLIEELRAQSITEFGYYDILEDAGLRAEIKSYKGWKTFPQVYVNGELIGGLDVIREIIADGEFDESFGVRQTLEQRMDALISKTPIVLFMKGSPQSPQCGFSSKMVELLRRMGLELDSDRFSSFDILTDESVRQGLKEYKRWRTYPQLYVDGELIGGLDVCVEMAEENELKEVLFSE